MSYSSLETIIEEMLLKSFGAFVRNLPQQDRRIFSLYLEGWTAADISRRLGSEFTTEIVHTAIARAKNEIKSKYSQAAAHRVRSSFNS